MGYSLYIMEDFENGLISRVYPLCWRKFFHRKLEIICTMDFDIFFGILIFDPE